MHERGNGGLLEPIRRWIGEIVFQRQTDALIRAQGGMIPTSALSQDNLDPAPESSRTPFPSNPADTCPFNSYADK